MNFSNFFSELKRRNVFRVGLAYAIAGWLVIQVFATIAPQLGFPDWVAPLVTTLVLIGLPLALIFAWAFELTPEGIRKSREVSITESVTDQTGKKLNGLIISILSLALVFLMVERFFFAEASFIESQSDQLSVQTASIAVLPFVNMSSDAENEYFSDGLSEELLNVLAKVKDLKVAGRTSSFKFKGLNINLSEIGKELGVAYILEGSVRKSGNRVRITAQLIKADDGYHVWSEAYERELTANDIFDIQDEISQNVMEELKVRILPEEKIKLANHPTQDIEAYNAFLEATQLEITFQPDDLEKAIKKYKEAIRLDPSFAEAYARLSMVYGYLHQNGNINFEEARTLMRENAEFALSLNQDLAKAHEAMGYYYAAVFEFDKSEASHRRAVELAPNDAQARMKYRGTLNRANKDDEADQQLFKAYELDPLNPSIANSYASYLSGDENRYEEAMTILNKIIERTPDYNGSYYSKAWLLRDVPYGELDNAFMFAFEAYQSDRNDMDFMWMLSDIARDLNMIELARYFGERIQRIYPENHAGPRNLIKTHLTEGNFEAADQIINQLKETYGERTVEFFVIQLTAINYSKGDYDQAIAYLFQRYPEFLNDPDAPITTKGLSTASIFYQALLNKKGDTELAKMYGDKVCTYMNQQLEEIRAQEHTEIYNELDAQLWCQIASGQYTEAVGTLEKFHFELNSKANWPLIFSSEIVYYPLKETEAYRKFEKRLHEDLASMRANVVDYLKREGEWKEEWGQEL